MSVTTAALATTTVRLAHRVRLRHAVTGETLAPVRASAHALPPGWWLRVRGGDVVLASRDGAPAPGAPIRVTVTVADPRRSLVLAAPSATVELTAADHVVDVQPAPMLLTVELTAPSSGAPATGRTVAAVATTGPAPLPAVGLPEVAPGVYRSAPVTWTSAFVAYDLTVDGNPLRRLAPDLTRTETRIRLVDTT